MGGGGACSELREAVVDRNDDRRVRRVGSVVARRAIAELRVDYEGAGAKQCRTVVAAIDQVRRQHAQMRGELPVPFGARVSPTQCDEAGTPGFEIVSNQVRFRGAVAVHAASPSANPREPVSRL